MTVVTLLVIFGGVLGIGGTLAGFAAQAQFNKDPNEKVVDKAKSIFKKNK